MTYSIQHFVDPTIPGLSGRDLVAGIRRRMRAPAAGSRLGSRRSPLRMDIHLLRDIGLDRDAL